MPKRKRRRRKTFRHKAVKRGGLCYWLEDRKREARADFKGPQEYWSVAVYFLVPASIHSLVEKPWRRFFTDGIEHKVFQLVNERDYWKDGKYVGRIVDLVLPDDRTNWREKLDALYVLYHTDDMYEDEWGTP